MKDPIMNKFKGIEIEKREMINSLMQDWKKTIPAINIKFKDDNKNYLAKDYFSSDGFFPGYFNRKPRILFIGREARWMTSVGYNDYIATFILDFFHRKGTQGANTNGFTRRLLYIAYGAKNNGSLNFKEVKNKTANCIAEEMINLNDYGYAIMNISKYSNDAEDGAIADKELINKFLEHSQLEKRNYFQEELAILDPDVIITGNLWDGKIKKEYLDLCFGKMKEKNKIDGVATISEIKIANKKIDLIDLYHFSCRYSDKDYFYDPVMKILFHEKI